MKKKKNGGLIAVLIILSLLFFAILELSKNTLWGWAATALLIAVFAVFVPRVQKRLPRFLCFLALLLLFALVLKATEPPYRAVPAVNVKNPETTGIVAVRQGELTGVYNEDRSVEVYAGIPYAKPPVGELRWKEPQEPESWSGVRACNAFAPMSMQQRDPELIASLKSIIGYHDFRISLDDNFREPVSEDSLYLNIWKPAGELDKAPVIFFIHGGSLSTGQPSYYAYRGESLAKKGVIVVNFAYRLNVFGYFASEELAAESPNGTTGNYGLLDQIAALRWVHENIASFGGDPDNITIAGESAGASSVNALCVSPLSEGLFRRAIAESSGITPVEPYHTFRTMDEALETGAKILTEQGVPSAAALRNIPAEQLVQTSFANDSMTVDGYALTEQPYLTYERGANHEEALLNGFNGREAEVFRLLQTVKAEDYSETLRRLLGDEAERAAALYPASSDKEATAQINEILGVCWFAYSHYDWSRFLVGQGRPVYEYTFTRQNGGISDWHSGEMIYAYGNLNVTPGNYGPADYELSEIMQSYWVNFARCGDPNGEGLPLWPSCAEQPGKLLRFDSPVELVDDPYPALYALIDAYQETFREKTEETD
ncbi:MAG: carboxylesterase family protein [Oscillospiraceae bacterium]|nr:carboxylesterase family protein [Oscillospiraceae bacterium]